MVKQKVASRSKTVKQKKRVAIDEQNPASADVNALKESLIKRKQRKKQAR